MAADLLAEPVAFGCQQASAFCQLLYFRELSQSRSFLSSETVSWKGGGAQWKCLRKARQAATVAST